jgi:cell cycle sensor histidine kinase DivJ
MLALRAREAGITLKKIVGESLPEIVADKRALNQILLNLVSNAIRFSDRGGKVTVSARAEAATMTFVVEDSGVGISEDDLARVGEPYFQTESSYDRRHSGTGLGLSIVKGLVRLHGGTISIRSRLGEGTLITVCLPLDCERAKPGKPNRSKTIVSAPHAINLAAGKAVALRAEQEALHDIPVRDDRAVKKSA